MDALLVNLALLGGACYLFKIWLEDYRAAKDGVQQKNSLPGIYPSSAVWISIGIIGAILLTGLETYGEYVIGVSHEQSDIPASLIFAMIGAGILEEVIFRGYLVVENRGRFPLWISIFVVSILFSLGHVQYYTDAVDTGGIWGYTITWDKQSLWTLSILFLNSLWFYALRFLPQNPNRSLIPCFAAHIASNIAVYFIKLAQGHVYLG